MNRFTQWLLATWRRAGGGRTRDDRPVVTPPERPDRANPQPPDPRNMGPLL